MHCIVKLVLLLALAIPLFAQSPQNHSTFNGNVIVAGPSPWIDVTAPPYLADKTGVADVTTAINNGIAACPAGGGVVYVPLGTYKHLSGITANAANCTIQLAVGATLKKGANIDCAITVSANNVTITGGGIVDGNSANFQTGANRGICISNGVSGTVIQNITVQNNGSTGTSFANISIGGASNFKILNSFIYGSKGATGSAFGDGIFGVAGPANDLSNFEISGNTIDLTGVSTNAAAVGEKDIQLHSTNIGQSIHDGQVCNNILIGSQNITTGDATFNVEIGGFGGDAPYALKICNNTVTVQSAKTAGGVSLVGGEYEETGNNIDYTALGLTSGGVCYELAQDFNVVFNSDKCNAFGGSKVGPFVLTSVDGGGNYTGTITGGGSNAYLGYSFSITGFANGGNNIAASIVTGSTTTTISFSVVTTIETHAGTATVGALGRGLAVNNTSFSKITNFDFVGFKDGGTGIALINAGQQGVISAITETGNEVSVTLSSNVNTNDVYKRGYVLISGITGGATCTPYNGLWKVDSITNAGGGQPNGSALTYNDSTASLSGACTLTNAVAGSASSNNVISGGTIQMSPVQTASGGSGTDMISIQPSIGTAFAASNNVIIGNNLICSGTGSANQHGVQAIVTNSAVADSNYVTGNIITNCPTGIKNNTGTTLNYDLNNVYVNTATRLTAAATTMAATTDPTSFNNIVTSAVGLEGYCVRITDGTATAFGATMTGSGTSHVAACSNGTNWTIVGN